MITGTRYQLQLEINRQLSLAGRIARTQTEISSEKKILAPSDDPVGSARISDIARAQADRATWKTNLEYAQALSDQADTTLTSTTTALTRAAELMVRANTSALSNEDRVAIAIELSSIAEEVATLRDTKDSRGQLLFANPASSANSIPVSAGYSITAVNSRDAVFGNVATTAGPQDLVTIISNAAQRVRDSNMTGITTSIDELNKSVTNIASAHGEQGARGGRIESLLETNIETNLSLSEERSGIEDTNIPEAVARLQSMKLSLDAAQAVFATVNRSNLFDLLT